jgi:DNA-directed RNA polymerase subunit L
MTSKSAVALTMEDHTLQQTLMAEFRIKAIRYSLQTPPNDELKFKIAAPFSSILIEHPWKLRS